MNVDLSYNDLLVIAKLLTMYCQPTTIFAMPPEYFKDFSKAVDALNTKLSRPEVNRFMIEEAEKYQEKGNL